MVDRVTRNDHLQDIQEYYRATRAHYRWIWSPEHLHFGYWEPGVHTNAQALRCMSEKLYGWTRMLGDGRWCCLDAGCGVGGTIQLVGAQYARSYGYGLTISPEQAKEGNERLTAAGRSRSWRILQGDYDDPPFQSTTFDRIWFLESFCYAVDHAATLQTMWDLLRPGGVLAIVDGFRGDGFVLPADEELFQDWAHGWAVRDLARPDDLQSVLLQLGAEHVGWEDITEHVLPSSEILYRRARRARWWLRWGWGSPWQKANIRSALLQREVFAKQLMRYGVLWARKPESMITQ